ncbi:MAG: hypothetical protein NTV34_10425 [Proteobacteria bacterium]|nr:hypothetical protein [Pseudomonadota bacterium]
MKTGFNKEPWKSLLPEVYDWAVKVPMDIVTDFSAGATHIVTLAEQKAEGDGDAIVLNAPNMSDALQKKVTQSLAASGWKGSGTHLAVVEGAVFLAVAPTKVKTTKPQRSRAIGLSAAVLLKSLKATHVIVCKAEGLCSKSVIDGLAQGLYACNSFKISKKPDSKDKATLPTRLSLWGGALPAGDEKALRAMIRATTLTRFIQDAPANLPKSVRISAAIMGSRLRFTIKHPLKPLAWDRF